MKLKLLVSDVDAERAARGGASLLLPCRSYVSLPQTHHRAVPTSSGKGAAGGTGWIHEIKHDGFRILARWDKERVRPFPRNGYDFRARFPKIATAVENLGVRSYVLDGEAVVVDESGLSAFNALRYRLRDDAAVLCAFDLIEPNGEDLRWQPLEQRKATLADVLRGVHDDPATVRLSSNRHARFAAKGLCRSGLARIIGPAGSTIGSRSRIRTGRRSDASAGRIGVDATQLQRISGN